MRGGSLIGKRINHEPSFDFMICREETMKKRKKIVLVIFAVLALLVIAIIAIPGVSDEQMMLSEIIDSLVYEDKSTNYDETYYDGLYNNLNKFFALENSQKHIEKEYKHLGEENAKDGYCHLKAAYAASMLQTHRYDEFKTEIESCKDLSADELKLYYSYIWIYGIETANKNESLDYNKVGEIIGKIQYSSADLQEQNLIFRYYWNLYWNTDMTDEFKNQVTALQSYSSNRSTYVLLFLTADKYDDFNRLFVSEYLNDPFDGVDIMILKGDLNKAQLNVLDDSLDSLEQAYITERNTVYPLKKEIINNLRTNK